MITCSYDTTRVRLRAVDLDVPGSDYVNANFVDGYSFQNAYIACQGPLSNTIEQFWMMVLQEKVQTIVMLTNLHENNRIKCDQVFFIKTVESRNNRCQRTHEFLNADTQLYKRLCPSVRLLVMLKLSCWS